MVQELYNNFTKKDIILKNEEFLFQRFFFFFPRGENKFFKITSFFLEIYVNSDVCTEIVIF